METLTNNIQIPASDAPASGQDFIFIRKFIFEKAAIVLAADKDYLIDSRLSPLAKQEGIGSLAELVRLLQTQSQSMLARKVVDAMTTNETSFFRDIHPFETLKSHVLPELIEKRKNQKTLRIWCGASSTGQEPYTVAMMFKESFPDLAGWKIRFVATDLCRNVLQRAKEGLYNQVEINRGLPAQHMLRYFSREGLNWRIREDLRQLIEFREMNLIERWHLETGWDVIFLRNVMIYFDVETKKRILAEIRKILSPDGYLFLGSSETTHGLDANYQRVSMGKSLCYQLIA